MDRVPQADYFGRNVSVLFRIMGQPGSEQILMIHLAVLRQNQYYKWMNAGTKLLCQCCFNCMALLDDKKSKFKMHCEIH